MRLKSIFVFFVLSFPSLGFTAGLFNFDQYDKIDLSHPYDEKTVYWPTSPSRFELKTLHRGNTEGGYFYSAFSICTPEHGGTHMDAPVHFSEKGKTVDEVPLTQLMGNAIVIDIQPQSDKNRDYRLTVSDVKDWERKFGKIPENAMVLLKTGWSKRWLSAKDYLGDEHDAKKLHFPSFGVESVSFLINERKINAIGVDTASIDYGPSEDFLVHRLVGAKNIPGFENLTHLEKLPTQGIGLIALPMKIAKGSGAPLRIVALVAKKSRL